MAYKSSENVMGSSLMPGVSFASRIVCEKRDKLIMVAMRLDLIEHFVRMEVMACIVVWILWRGRIDQIGIVEQRSMLR